MVSKTAEHLKNSPLRYDYDPANYSSSFNRALAGKVNYARRSGDWGNVADFLSGHGGRNLEQERDAQRAAQSNQDEEANNRIQIINVLNNLIRRSNGQAAISGRPKIQLNYDTDIPDGFWDLSAMALAEEFNDKYLYEGTSSYILLNIYGEYIFEAPSLYDIFEYYTLFFGG